MADTHDRFDLALTRLFAGVDFILHAGDIAGAAVLKHLEAIAPVRAVRGNVDEGAWAAELPAARVERFLGLPVLMIHDLGTVAEPSPAARFLLEAEKPTVVISGHSHAGLLQVKDGILFFNPGSAGPARFELKPAAGLLHLTPGLVRGELFALKDGKARKVGEQQLTVGHAD